MFYNHIPLIVAGVATWYLVFHKKKIKLDAFIFGIVVAMCFSVTNLWSSLTPVVRGGIRAVFGGAWSTLAGMIN